MEGILPDITSDSDYIDHSTLPQCDAKRNKSNESTETVNLLLHS